MTRCQRGNEFFGHSTGAVDAAHQGVREELGNRGAFVDRASELFEGEHNVDVFASICEVVCEVRRPKFGQIYVGRDRAV